MSNVFKAYDIRGVYPEELNKDLAFKIGGATVKFLKAKTLVVGEDARISSPPLRGAIIDAATKAGANIHYIGQCTTPLFYYSVNKLKADGGIMVTASHNPPHYGGLKIVGAESRPIGLETGLPEIQKLAENRTEPAQKEGTVNEVNFTEEYVGTVISRSKINPVKARNLKFIIDSGNGMTPVVLIPLLAKLKLNATKIHFEIDGGFPNRSPDVSKEENLRYLKERIIQSQAQFGVAFDGDGDRIVFLDKEGKKVDSGFILGIIFKMDSSFLSKPKTVYDLRFSRSVKELLGGNGIKTRVGHAFIKNKMRETDAELGGELSGHFFFKNMGFVESSVLVMLKVLKVLSESKNDLSEMIKPFQRYAHSGEINIEISTREQGLALIQRFKDKYNDGKIDELDGVTIEYKDWWFNLRLSNTEPIIRLVVEGNTWEIMRSRINELTAEIKRSV